MTSDPTFVLFLVVVIVAGIGVGGFMARDFVQHRRYLDDCARQAQARSDAQHGRFWGDIDEWDVPVVDLHDLRPTLGHLNGVVSSAWAELSGHVRRQHRQRAFDWATDDEWLADA